MAEICQERRFWFFAHLPQCTEPHALGGTARLFCDTGRVHSELAWAKLRALVEGAQLASKNLWRR